MWGWLCAHLHPYFALTPPGSLVNAALAWTFHRDRSMIPLKGGIFRKNEN